MVFVTAVGMVWAQTAPPPQPPQLVRVPTAQPANGVVIGTVIAQDTQRPARFAQVQLINAAQVQSSLQGNGGGADFGFAGGSVNLRTDVDGTFEADNVAVGDYYVTATATGYIAERALLQAQVAAGGDPAALLASLPQVHVTADATSSVTVSMQRGGALAGHIEWEDGSAAAGVSVTATPSTAAASLPGALRGLGNFGGGTPFAQTDDRGNFRMSGIVSGDYLVMATIQPSAQTGGFGRGGAQFTSPIRVYAPGVFRKADAKPVNVRAGDERTDLRMVLDLRLLRTVSGSASSSNPGLNVASGRVSLTDASDSSLTIQGSISASGTFRLPYVPSGSYTLQVSGASTQASGGYRRGGASSSATPATSFQTLSQTLVVGDADVSGVALSLTPVASTAK
jgi:hypothetical protein